MTPLSPQPFLLPLAWLYGLAVEARNVAFDIGVLPTNRVGVPVVSVGNLTSGGTGKTPLVGEIVRYLQSLSVRVGVVSRGYGRSTSGCVVVSDGKQVLVDAAAGGDEPVMLAGQFPGTVMVVAERRTTAAGIAVQRYGVGAVVMDDGFQHRALGRDLNILVVDGSRDLRSEMLLPAGVRREWLRNMRRADLVAVTKVDSQADVERCRVRMQRWFRGQMVGVRTVLRGVMQASADGPIMAALPGRPFAFCGIGSPEGFASTVAHAGVQLAGMARFPDHHRYSPDDLREIARQAREAGAVALLTTEKDAVRLMALGRAGNPPGLGLPLYWLNIGLEFLDGGKLLSSRLDRLLNVKSEP